MSREQLKKTALPTCVLLTSLRPMPILSLLTAYCSLLTL